MSDNPCRLCALIGTDAHHANHEPGAPAAVITKGDPLPEWVEPGTRVLVRPKA